MADDPCEHAAGVDPAPAPGTPGGCAECLGSGGTWVNLRLCLTCGHVGCCDSSPGTHATVHAQQTGHPVVRSYEPGQDWWWCFDHQVTFEVEGAPRAPSHA